MPFSDFHDQLQTIFKYRILSIMSILYFSLQRWSPVALNHLINILEREREREREHFAYELKLSVLEKF